MPVSSAEAASPEATVERIRALVQDALRPERLEIHDDSAAHAGHAGAAGGKGHFRLHIVSERFTGMAPLARHRLVHEVLAGLLATRIHALTLKTDAPGERR
jgi:BolA protein